MTNEELPFTKEEIEQRIEMYNDYVKQIGESYNVPPAKARRILKSLTRKNIKKFHKQAFKNKDKEKVYINPEEVLSEIENV